MRRRVLTPTGSSRVKPNHSMCCMLKFPVKRISAHRCENGNAFVAGGQTVEELYIVKGISGKINEI